MRNFRYGPSVSAKAGRVTWPLYFQIGRSSWICWVTSATKASPTPDVVASSPKRGTRKLNFCSHESEVTGVLQPRSTVSTMPLNRITLNPGP